MQNNMIKTECHMSVDEILEKPYDEKHKKKVNKQKKEIDRLIDLDVLTPKERTKLNENQNKTDEQMKREYEKERKRLYREKLKKY